MGKEMKTLAEIRKELEVLDIGPRIPADNLITKHNGKIFYRSPLLEEADTSNYDYYYKYFESRWRYAVLVIDHTHQVFYRKYFGRIESAQTFIKESNLIAKLGGNSLQFELLDLRYTDYPDWYVLQAEAIPFDEMFLTHELFPQL